MAEILISNKMTSRYSLVGYREDTMQFEMLVGNYKSKTMAFEIRARALKKKKLPFELEVKYSGTSTMGFEITPRINKHLGFEIEVAPHNMMYSRYELIEPPVKKWSGFPVQDSYVLSESPYSSINYGGNNSLVVGTGSRGEASPYVQFDLSGLEQNIRIKNAKFRLFFNDMVNSKFDLYQVNEAWREFNITYLNAPKDLTFITSNYTINNIERYIEFDVTDEVQKWALGIPNNGFSLTSKENTTTAFRSRETDRSPELYVEYFSSEPINIGRKRMPFSIIPRQSDETKMPFDIEVISYYTSDTMGFSIFAHDPEHFYPSKMPFEIYASRMQTEFEFIVKRPTTDKMPFIISVAEDKITRMPFEIFVPSFDGSKTMQFEITPSFSKDKKMPFEIFARKVYKNDTAQMPFEIFAQGIYKDKKATQRFEITAQKKYVTDSSTMPFSITPRFFGDSSMRFEVEALTDYKGTFDVMPFEISVRGSKEQNMPFELFVSKPQMPFNIIVPHVGSNTMPFEVSARKLIVDTLTFEITVGEVVKTYSYIYII